MAGWKLGEKKKKEKMNFRFFHGMIGKNYGWEFNLFSKIRDWCDGVSIIEFNINLDRYPSDHNPKFEIFLTLFNITIFEFTIYNIWHIDHQQSPYYDSAKSKWKWKVIYHSRKKFYYGKDINWYEFLLNENPYNIDLLQIIPCKFLNIFKTKYFEYGGSHEEAINDLNLVGIYDIVEGEEI